MRINVQELCPPTDPEDIGVAGIYEVSFAVATAGLTPSKMASMVLDIFHSNVAIGMLDDFDIAVIDANDQFVEQDPTHEDYSARGAGNVRRIGNEQIRLTLGSLP